MVSFKIDLFLAIWFSALFLPGQVTTKQMYDLIVGKLTCEDFDPRLIYNASCVTRAYNRTTRTHSVLVNTLPNVSLNDVFVHISYYQKINAGFRRSIIDSKEDLCGFLNGTSKSFLIRILWPTLKKYSNLDHTCPFSGTFNITNMIIADDLFPPVLPEGQARLAADIRNGAQGKSIMKAKLDLEVKPKGAFKLDF